MSRSRDRIRRVAGPYLKGDRVRVRSAHEPWDGRTAVVTRVPGEEATPGSGLPSSTYAVHIDGEPCPCAPFDEDDLTPVQP